MPFATLNDLAVVMGRTDEGTFTDAEAAQGTLLLDLATGRIADGVGKDADWAEALTSVPATLRSVTLEAVRRVMGPSINNPTGVSSESETIGAYSHTVRYGENGSSVTAEAAGLEITDDEMRKCRRAVWGRLSATTMPATTLDLVVELAETGEIAAFPAT